MNDTVTSREGFLRRWARLKAAPEPAFEPAPESAPEPALPPLDTATPAVAQAPERQMPTLDDVARLTPQSDYSAFVGGGVDPAVRRLALKKLFADPNFAVMDGLDIYIDDYTKASPLTDVMLASLRHAPGVLARLFDNSDEPGQAAADDMQPVVIADATGPALEIQAAPVAQGHNPSEQGNA
jgi:hypothetical protein